MNTSHRPNAAIYVPTALDLYLSLAESPIRTSAMDHWQARLLQQRPTPGCCRVRFPVGVSAQTDPPKDVPPLSPFRFLAYFLPAIEGLLADPSPDDYLDYLRLKLNRILDGKEEDINPVPADTQKTTLSKDR